MAEVLESSWLPLSNRFWLVSSAIAMARKTSNDSIRATIRDRGEQLNIENDIQGVVGELACIAKAEADPECSDVSHDIFSVEGPVDDVDLRFIKKNKSYRIETKCLMWEKRKRRFLINQTAHKRSKARGADGYIPVITVAGGKHALIGSFFTLSRVEKWEVFHAGYGDPALSINLEDFLRNYLGCSNWTKIINRIEQIEGGKEWIQEIINKIQNNEALAKDIVKCLMGSSSMSIRQLSDQLIDLMEGYFDINLMDR